MDEVDRRIVGQALQRRGRPAHAQLVPSHVRHLEPGNVGEADHVAGKHVQAGVEAVLVAAREQQLHPQADAEKRFARLEVFLDRFDQANLVQTGDGVAKRSDAGQHHLVAPAPPFRDRR